MTLLIIEIWAYLVGAFLLGMFVQWFFCCRGRVTDSNRKLNTGVGATSQSDPIEGHVSDGESTSPNLNQLDRPTVFDSAPNQVDELKRIKGIGEVIETTLNELGIYQFQQIADWDENNTAWVENYLSFPGRIGREQWISQAQTLANGGKTEFSERVDKGDVGH